MFIQEKTLAENEAYQYFHENIRPLPKKLDGTWDFSSGEFLNNEVDAFRHAYVSGAFTIKYGETTADVLGLANEIKGDIKNSQPEQEKNMDLWNNRVGREYGDVAKKNHASIEELGHVGVIKIDHDAAKLELANSLKTALVNNELITTVDTNSDSRQYEDQVYEDYDNLGYLTLGYNQAHAAELDALEKDNTLLDFESGISPTSNNAGINPDAWEEGSALHGGDYSANMPIDVINGPGLTFEQLSKNITDDSY